jgi:PAS domain S-box-containing protein
VTSPVSHEIRGVGLEEVLWQMPAAVVIVEASSGRIVHANPRAREMTERQLGRPVPPKLQEDFEIFHPDGRPYEMDEWPLVRSISSGEEVANEEYFNVLADGSRLMVRCSSSPVYDDEGEIIAGVLVMDDITEQRLLEERLTRHAGLLENVEDAVISVDEQFRVTSWNKGAEKLYGWTEEEVLGLDAMEHVRLGMTDAERWAMRRETTEVGRMRVEALAEHKDGTRIDIELINVAVRDERGEITGYFGIHRDVTERKRAEEALREAHQRSETILESIADAFVAFDREWRYTYVNERALRRIEEWTGKRLRREDVLGKVSWELFPDAIGTEVEQRLRDAMRGPDPVEFELYFEPTGEWVEVRAYPSQAGLSIYYHHITERKQAEEALRTAQRRSETILESITEAFYALDEHLRFTYLNERALARMRTALGEGLTHSDVLGKNYLELFPELVGTAFDELYHIALGEQEPVRFEAYSPPSGGWVEVHVYPSKEGLSVYARDINERKRAEEERESRARQQALVADLGLRALAGEDLQPLMDEAVSLIARTLDVELAGIAEVLPGREQLLLRSGVGWKEGVAGKGTALAGPGSLLAYTIASGEPVVSVSLTTDERFEISELLSEHDAMSGATVVIGGRDEAFGSLGAFSKQPRSFSEHDLNFMQAVANVLATVVERTQGEQKLQEVREAERRRIARDLHDEALQELTHALALAKGDAAGSTQADRANPLVPALKRVGEQLRGAIYDLRLEEQAGRPFAHLLEAVVALHGAMAVDCEVELDLRDGMPSRPLGSLGTELIRITGEALTNARRHASAQNIRVSTWGSEGRLFIEVADDGRGFNPDKTPDRGTGISGMRERADLLGADLKIGSEPASGTRVRVEVALTEEHQAAVEQVRLLLLEDHAAVRQAIASAFEQEPDFRIVGQAASLTEARRRLEGVDVAVVDLGLPDGYGGELITELRKANPQAQALVLSASLDRAEIARAVESGAAGVLNKAAHLDEVVDAVRRLRAGETLLPMDEIVELLRFAERMRGQERLDRQAIEQLTAREREVLQALADGLDSQGVAERLHITIRTERNHIASILAKLGLHSQLQALVFALRYGVVEIR